ncbi:MAG TPA: WecB/TagA/CpsF family glycosyltransferase [Streptosporangiaceae bacterium]|nr:WecB/TagA/CpsF family glycosyltransferase [Streptosporangiaceae bacterium]
MIGELPGTGTPAGLPAGLPGMRVDPLSMKLALKRCTDVIDGGGYLRIGMVNAAKVVAMRKDEELRAAVCDSDLVLADGQAIVWASGLLGAPLPERVTGIDLFTGLLAEAAGRGYRVYFLGARAEVLHDVLAEVARTYPGLIVAGHRDGYFSPAEDAKVAAEIRASRADLLFIAMSPPRKELFASRWGEATGAKVVHGVGGSFDILAGRVRRAPAWWQRHGLEWLFRALQEPVRLGRRYLTTNLAFIAYVAAAVVKRGLQVPAAGATGEQ